MEVETRLIYNSKGDLTQEVQTLNGLKHGCIRMFDDTGRVSAESYYKKDLKEGYSFWYDYDSEGKVRIRIKTIKYKL